jgi:hypothetical protein
MQIIQSKGFYFPQETYPWMQQPKQDSCYMSYFRSTRRRFHSPGIAEEAIVVRYYGYRGYYNDQMYLESQYAYYSIYDAMRQVLAYRESEYEGKIELLFYTDESGFELIRSWEYETEGYVNMDGDTVIECDGWVRV